jgi:hypothetical protein
VEDVLAPTRQFGDRVRVLASRPADEMLFGLVPPERLDAFVEGLKHTADVVLFVAPSPTSAPDTLALADAVDAVVVTVDLGRTRRARLAELRRDLGSRAIVPAGFFVIGRRRLRRSGRSGISLPQIPRGDAEERTKLSRREPTYH